MKKAKKTLCGLLAAALVFALFPVSALAAEIGTPTPVSSETIYQNDTFLGGNSSDPVRVYFGANGGGTPIPWRVLAADSGSWLLIAGDQSIMGTRIFDLNSSVWATSSLRAFLNGDFYGYFHAAEQSAILSSNTSEGANWGAETDKTDKIFCLSVNEANTYFANNADRQYGGTTPWWLRSQTFISSLVAAVLPSGAVDNMSGQGMATDDLMRPAFRLDFSAILFTSAAMGGKDVTPGPALSAATQPAGDLKLTLLDSNLTLAAVTPVSATGRTITFEYTGATAGKTLSATVTASDGTVKYYGQLATVDISGDGTASVTVPDDFIFAPLTGDTLKIFVEEANDDRLTDFASAALILPVALSAPPMNLTGVDCTTILNNNGKILGTTAAMEYSLDNGATWHPCTDVETTRLVPGDYLVRIAASSQAIASEAVPVTVGPYRLQITPGTGGNTGGTVHTVTFDGGAGGTSTTRVPTGARVPQPANPVHIGYTFTGWYTDAALTQPWDFSAGVYKDMTLYAGWAPDEVVLDPPKTGDESSPWLWLYLLIPALALSGVAAWQYIRRRSAGR